MTLIAETVLDQQAYAFAVIVMVTLPIAWLFGRGPERSLAMATTIVIALDLLRQKFLLGEGGATVFRPDHAFLDTLVLLCLGAVALRANRFYPLVMTGAALIAVLAHGLRWLDLIDGRFGYQVLITAPAVVIVMSFWIGLAHHILRERRVGPYPDWRSAGSTANDCRPAWNGIA